MDDMITLQERAITKDSYLQEMYGKHYERFAEISVTHWQADKNASSQLVLPRSLLLDLKIQTNDSVRGVVVPECQWFD